MKQCYGLEHIRVMSYASWRNMSALVLATTYFTAAWLRRGVRKDVLVAHIEHMHQRFSEVPEFFLYAHSCQGIAFGDSLRSGDTPRLEATPDTRGSLQLLKS